MPPRKDYGNRSEYTNRTIGSVQIGDLVRCVYCEDGLVEITECMEGPGALMPIEPNDKIPLQEDFWCEGDCTKCGRHVDYDYRPQLAG